jgi:ankyrin repeat protein
MNKKEYISLIIMAIFLLAAFIAFNDNTTDNTNNVQKVDEETVIGCAQTLISENLKSPGSARWVKSEVIAEDKYGRYLVDIVVDSQNSFGALLRDNFFVVLQSVSKDGKFTYLTFSPFIEYYPKYGKDSDMKLAKKINDWNKPKNNGANSDSETLFDLTKNGSISEIKEFIYNNDNININVQDEDGNTPLFHAINNEDLKIVEFLIDNGANISIENNSGQTPLLVATEVNNIDIIKTLVNNGAEVNVRDNNYYTPRMIATLKHSSRGLNEYFMDNGADFFAYPEISSDDLKGLLNYLDQYFLDSNSKDYLKNVQSQKINKADEILVNRINNFNFFLMKKDEYSFNSSVEKDLNNLIIQLEKLGNIEIELFELSKIMANNTSKSAKYQDAYSKMRTKSEEHQKLVDDIYKTVYSLKNKMKSEL